MPKVYYSNFLKGGAVAVLGLGSCAQPDKPNIIVIYADDMGYGDLSCYGSTRNRTPHLDQMAKDGIRFTDFYSPAPVSSPSRAAFLTGRHAIRMGINHVFHPESFTGIPANEIKLSELLRHQGYRTAVIGKWHLGHHHQFLPLQNGFDEFYGLPYVHDMRSIVHMRGNDVEQFHVNLDSATYHYTQESLRFIEKHKDRPFFLFMAHIMPHVPIVASANFKGRSANGLYGDAMEELDWSVGEVLKKLDELGLDKNTIVVFSSDNGGWCTEGPFGGDNTPLFQGKGTTWEGGQRVPAIVRWRDRVRGGQVNSDVASMMDWFPTFLTLAGGTPPTDRIIDGCDLTPVLFGTGKRANADFAYLHWGRLEAYRSGDWKIKLPEKLYEGNFWVEDVPAHDTLFFNLRHDISERTDVKSLYPDEYRTTLTRMNQFAETLNGCPPGLIFSTVEGVQLTNRQRMENIREAKAKGITSKSPADDR